MMVRVFTVSRVLTAVFAAVLATTMMSSRETVRAQTQSGAPSYRLILSPERALSFVEAAEKHLNYLPGEVVLKVKNGVSTERLQRALDALRGRPSVSQLRWIDRQTAVVKDVTEANAELLAGRLRAQPEVASAEPNYLFHTSSAPNDPSFSSRQWNFTALDLPRAWDISPGANANVTVAVVDTGITTVAGPATFQALDGQTLRNVTVPFATNPDLAASRLVTPRDFVFWTGPVVDMVGHGTHVSSTIGEDTNNGVAEAGIAYNVKVMPVKVCVGYWEILFSLSASGFRGTIPPDVGGCPDDAIVEGLRYAADNGAKVINLSLGGDTPAASLQDALLYVVGKGAFVAIAVGNEFEDGNPTEYPAAYAATIDGVMSVGAVGKSLTRAFYSNTGTYLEIAAPGGNFLDGGAGGLVWQASICPQDSDPDDGVSPRFDRYCEVPEQGTSMAAPHVAGTAALLISRGITSPAIVEALIKKTAKDLGTPGKDDEFGFGLVQPRAALFGFGLSK